MYRLPLFLIGVSASDAFLAPQYAPHEAALALWSTALVGFWYLGRWLAGERA